MPSTAKKQPAGGRRGRSSFGIAIAAALGRGRSSFGIAIAALGRGRSSFGIAIAALGRGRSSFGIAIATALGRGRSSFGIAIAALGRGRSSFGIAIAALGRLLPPPFRRRRRIHTIELDPPLSLEGLTDLSERLVILQQSALVQFDLKLNPRQPPPPPRTRTAPVAVRDVYRRRRRPGPLTSSRTIPPLIALTLVAPAIALAASYAGLHFYESYVNEFQPPELVSINEPSNGTKILDRNGRLLYEYLHETAGQRLPVRLDQVSDAFLAATIATEDNSFFSNIGLNPRGLVRAVWENFSPLIEDKDRILKGSGGRSITQQLVKNVYIPREERLKRSLDRKAREAAYALELTQRYDKRQILEWYVNQISYGGYFNGIETASQGYFGKPASALTLTEAALLAGMPQSPARYDPVTRPEAAIERRNSILDLIARRGAIQIGEDRFYRPSAAAIAAAKTAPLALHLKEFLIEAPHFVFNQVQPELEALFGREALYQDGLVVRTSIDLDLNYQAQSKLEHWISEFEAGSNSRNGTVIVIDAPTGEIIAYLGSRDYFREDLQGNVNNLTALNSPGSTFKPFIYLASFLKLGWDPSTIINDAPVSFVESDGTVFQPLNPVRGSYLGPIPLKTALGNSLNVPAFRTALKLGVPAIVEVAKQVGFTTLDGQYGPAIAIGGVDLSPFDLAYASSVLANNGVMVGQRAIIPHRDDERTLDPISVLQVEDRDGNVVYDVEQRREQRRVVPAKQAYLMTSILMDGDNQCVTFGCGGVTIPGREAGVKTGTSEPFDPAGPNAGKIGET